MILSSKKNGFTVIELMLAMTFISVLLIAIVMAIIQAGKIYNRGLILRSVNQVGRDISDTIRRDFIQTDQRMIERMPSGQIVRTMNDGGQPMSSRFCLGRYSYIWNHPRVLDLNLNNAAVVKSSDGKPINLVRVVDEDASMCQTGPSGGYPVVLTDDSKVTHLLKSQTDGSEVVLAIHDLSVTQRVVVSDGTEGLFEINFTVGTSKISEISTVDQSCRPPIDMESNMEFCAINQFNMIVRTNG